MGLVLSELPVAVPTRMSPSLGVFVKGVSLKWPSLPSPSGTFVASRLGSQDPSLPS